MVEAYHNGLKSGCTIERRRLERAARMRPLLGLLALIAERLRRGREAARRIPEAVVHGSVPAAFTRTVVHRQNLAAEAMPIAGSGVTKLGGSLGRRSDGERTAFKDPDASGISAIVLDREFKRARRTHRPIRASTSARRNRSTTSMNPIDGSSRISAVMDAIW